MPNLQPLYDIKERLEHAAIAGTGLLAEDFRLTRAAEGLAPLAKASPVFARIDAGVKALLAAPPEKRSHALLDTLALVDAVAYTQGAAGCAGDLSPLPPAGGTVHILSYGQLHPLLEALTGTGGGRVNVVQNHWEVHPEHFQDFRILPAVIDGLGDSYNGLADLNAEILKSMGPAILPRLQGDFDPTGKKDMVRRVGVIAAVGKEDAGPWLRQTLPQAKRDVREAILNALCPFLSIQELLEMAIIEKGKCKDAVLRGLALREGPEVKSFWQDELKRRTTVPEFMQQTSTVTASDLVAEQLRSLFETGFADGWPGPTGFLQSVADWLHAAVGKTSPAMIDFWRWIDSRYQDVPSVPNKSGRFTDLKTLVPSTLLLSLLKAGPGPVADVCLELYLHHTEEALYVRHGFLAALLLKPAAEVYSMFSPYLLLEDGAPSVRRRQHDELLSAMHNVMWSQRQMRQIVSVQFPVAEPMDPRWFERLAQVLMRGPLAQESQYSTARGGEVVGRFDADILGIADPSNPEICAYLMPYLKKRMTTRIKTASRMEVPWMTYAHYILRFGGSLRGILAEGMAACTKPIFTHYIWKIFDDHKDIMSAAEIADVLEEIEQGIQEDRIPVDYRSITRSAIPYTVAELRAGRPYPEWSVWWEMNTPASKQ